MRWILIFRRRYAVLVQLTVCCSGAFGELLNWPVRKREEGNIRHFSGDKMTRRVTRYLTTHEARATVSLHAWWDEKRGESAKTAKTAKRRLQTSTSAAALNDAGEIVRKTWYESLSRDDSPNLFEAQKAILRFLSGVCVKAFRQRSSLPLYSGSESQKSSSGNAFIYPTGGHQNRAGRNTLFNFLTAKN